MTKTCGTGLDTRIGAKEEIKRSTICFVNCNTMYELHASVRNHDLPLHKKKNLKEGECSNHRRINMITENELMLKILI